ncbi:sugar ABC transporter substrate-binding protein [Lapillicoccus jejuensis]|uniref:Ribose transport system substrate-binding protein n=1 Tax=Lapillicoccus jejuensis TaxID=402171 RepID=A0A542E0Z8_9MICO|nr:substrate-binding domain-containing protein [Lapillicoccus jejuensis]TQJ09020.1 ribose transport system substrate-binding protein [Lapillicoccus jejuensis]
MNRKISTLSTAGRTTAGLAVLAISLSACQGVQGVQDAAGAGSSGGSGSPSSCATDQTFSTDDASDSAQYADLATKLGAVPKPAGDVRIGSIMKFLGNQYWSTLSKGQTERAQKYGSQVDVQAAASESDQVGQLNAAETMVTKGYKLILASPQSDTNMCPAVEKAEAKGLVVVNVNDAVFPSARHWVGPNQIQNGISAADYMAKTLPAGASVAIIQGQAGVYAAKQRTKGFTDEAGTKGLKVVSSVAADWDVQKARDAATTILQEHPDLGGFYANNDTMALGVAEAVKAAGKTGKVEVIGTDGIPDAYKAIRSGDLTATVDSYPELTGAVAVDVGLRLLGGQTVPRAVYTPQALITKDNVDAAAPVLQ